MKPFFVCFLLHSIFAAPQINLYYTAWIREDSNHALEHNCLRITDCNTESNTCALGSFCLGESPPTFSIDDNVSFPNLTFAALVKQNITSRQLYLWSAPIDVIEQYQLYLDQLFMPAENVTLSLEVFYNCTLPRFGPKCQYELEYYASSHASLFNLLRAFYKTYPYHPTVLTCYELLQCDRGPQPSCLDWTEICDGHIDCLDGNFDEEHCWQLEINVCQENEYRCANGQCIPRLFSGDVESGLYDCTDASDEIDVKRIHHHLCEENMLAFRCEDIVCPRNGLTSSCLKDRIDLLVQAMFSIKDESIFDECWSAFKCLMYIYQSDDGTCADVCYGSRCVEMIQRTCPGSMLIPNVPVLFGHIYFGYQKNASQLFLNGRLQSLYVCYNHTCYDDYFISGSKTVIDHLPCRHRVGAVVFSDPIDFSRQPSMFHIHELLRKYYQVFNYTSTFCNRSSMYQCMDSVKCISRHRCNDGIDDCPRGDDENRMSTSDLFSNEQTHSFSSYWHNRERAQVRYLRLNISFQTVCNGYTELLPIEIGGRNETDETECEQWECNNIYTRCNDFWNCPNGADELGCALPFKIKCSPNEHLCMAPDTHKLRCLPVEKANNSHVDCFAGTDEPNLCRNTYELDYPDNFYCMNTDPPRCVNAIRLCDGRTDCTYGDDEQFCDYDWERLYSSDFCYNIPEVLRPDSINYICRTLRGRGTFPILAYFSLVEPRKISTSRFQTNTKQALLSSSSIEHSRSYQPQCHRGLDLRVWLNDQTSSRRRTCLCPPNFYGDRCQYQNQRVSLALRFRALSDSWRTPFAIVISLIDDSEQRSIHSYEQLTYLSLRDCQKKFDIYLLYAARPKNASVNHAIQIDIYEKISLTYRGSYLFPIQFPFLPFHRMPMIIDIPRSKDSVERCYDHGCIHGQCVKYLNNVKTRSFCRCDLGWSGEDCSIRHQCQCSSDSLCLGISARNHRSVCICRPNRFGPRCLINTVCDENDRHSRCQHNGQCIPTDDYTLPEKTHTCLCPKNLRGSQCESKVSQITITFDKNIPFSQSIFIHFILAMGQHALGKAAPPERATTFVTHPIQQDSLAVYWWQLFNIVFLEFPTNNYYLILVQKNPRLTARFRKTIRSSDRCPHINEVFNETFRQWHPLRQIKYYHRACQEVSLNLSCFHDNFRMCLCYDYQQKRLANCFEFEHNMTLNCHGQSECENEAQCFQDHPVCPARSMCSCRPCFYGRLCQFSTSGFGLSLDGILGYHILPQASIRQQSTIVHISMAFTIILTITGLINGILALITFQSKVVLEYGCGLYLLTSSIFVLLTTVLFGLKFWILTLSQMGLLVNKLFLSWQCYSIDYLLRVCLNTEQWLNACVAIERAITAQKGMNFDKNQSRRTAKCVIVIVFILNVVSIVYDPLHRRLIEEGNDENDEIRLWCIVSYSSRLQVLNTTVYIIHFFGPFMINLISAILLVAKKSHQRSNLQADQSFRRLLQQQLHEHKHLFTAAVSLVMLALPRLVIVFVSKCMESANDSWIFLLGYFISFIPPVLTFIIFVLPSTVYKNEFHKNLTRYRLNIQRWFRSSS